MTLRLFLIISFFLPLQIFAQVADDEHKFSMQGSFRPIEVFPTQGTYPPIQTPPENRFVLRWNEINNQVRGVYTDTYFATTATPVTGTVLSTGRSFHINLNDVVRGVRTIDVDMPAIGSTSGTVTSTVSTKNSIGMSTSSYTVPVLLSVDPTAAEVADLNDPAETCVVGMGALTGFCGKYSGTITTLSDSAGKCDPALDSAQLELTPTGDFIYRFSPNANAIANAPGVVAEHRHYIGGLNGNGPVSPDVDIRRIHCDTLPGTGFDVTDHCLTLKLSGTFSDVAGVRSFNGTYTIQKNDLESCTLSLGLTRH